MQSIALPSANACHQMAGEHPQRNRPEGGHREQRVCPTKPAAVEMAWPCKPFLNGMIFKEVLNSAFDSCTNFTAFYFSHNLKIGALC